MPNVYYKHRYIALGVIGALLIITGITQNPPQLYYVSGAAALLATAFHYNLLYFIALELILIAGHAAVLLGSGPYTRVTLPILLCFQLLLFFLIFSKEKSFFIILGVSGIALLSVGFSYNNQWIFFSGSLFIAIYDYYSGYRGEYPAYIWAALNTFFALLALYKLFLL